MKKLTSKILFVVLASVYLGSEAHGEIITLTTSGANKLSKSVEVTEGQVLKVLHIKKSTQTATRIHVNKDDIDFEYIVDQDNKGQYSNTKSGSDFVFQVGATGGSGGIAAAVPLFSNLIFQGPLKFTISTTSKPSLVTVEVTSNDYGAGSGNNVTVIPESADDSTLVLEGSDDMVNWTVEALGDKPKANRKKFYRLRAKKK